MAAAAEPGNDAFKAIHQRHFEEGMREVLAGKAGDAAVAAGGAASGPGLEEALALSKHASTRGLCP